MEAVVAQKINIPEIVKTYGDRLKGFIRKRVSRTEDAEDILQDVFYQLSEADRMTRPIDQMASWLFTVARNRITDLYRKRTPDFLPDYIFSNEEDDELNAFSELLAEESNSPETAYLRMLVKEEFEKSLEQLPIEQREVFVMHELEDLSFKQIAEITGQSINTLISRKHYAVLFLRDRLRILYNELINF